MQITKVPLTVLQLFSDHSDTQKDSLVFEEVFPIHYA